MKEFESTAVAVPAPPPPQALLERLKDYGQEDAFALWDELSPEERDLLVKDIEASNSSDLLLSSPSSLDLSRVDRIFRCSLKSQGLPTPTVEPVPEAAVSTVEVRTLEERERWWKMGLKAILEGKLAVLLLSGGQMPMVERLYFEAHDLEVQIPRVVSEDDSIAILDSHLENHYFNYKLSGFCVFKDLQLNLQMMVTFFRQGTIPCVSKDGRFIMETPYKVELHSHMNCTSPELREYTLFLKPDGQCQGNLVLGEEEQ
ncbi:hypothetical protein ACLOJK_021284 [Asimina triloba]